MVGLLRGQKGSGERCYRDIPPIVIYRVGKMSTGWMYMMGSFMACWALPNNRHVLELNSEPLAPETAEQWPEHSVEDTGSKA